MDNKSSSEAIEVSRQATPSASVLHVRGEVDLLTAPSLREQFMQLVIEGGGSPIIVECAGLRYLDMTGVRVLEDCHRQAERQGVRLILVGSWPLVDRIFTIVKLDQRLPLVETMAGALKAMGQD